MFIFYFTFFLKFIEKIIFLWENVYYYYSKIEKYISIKNKKSLYKTF